MVTAGKKLAKVTGIATRLSPVGPLTKLGFGTAIMVAGKADNPAPFMASKGLEGLEALCLTSEFVQWVEQPQGKEGPQAPRPVLEALQKALPGARAASEPRRFDNDFWAQRATFDGQPYIVVHRSGLTSILAPANSWPGWASQAMIGLGYLCLLVLAGWCALALVAFFRGASMGRLAPSRLAQSYMAAITPRPMSERTQGILGVLGCLVFMGLTVSHHLWIRQIVATPIVRTAADLARLDWNGESLLKLECEPGPVLRKSDDEEYQLRIVGDLAVVAYFDDDRLPADRLLIGYAKPLPAGLLETIERRSQATPVGMVECRWVDESSGVLWWFVMWFSAGFAGLVYFVRRLRRA
jgi:hypothetical protein